MKAPRAVVALLVLVGVAAPTASAQEAFEFYSGFSALNAGAGTGFSFQLQLLHQPGTPSRPEAPVERANLFTPDGTRFGFSYVPAFCRNPDDCPPRSQIGSGEIFFNYGPRGDQGFRGDIFVNRGGFVFVPLAPLGSPPQPFELPPPLQFERDRNRFDVVFPTGRCAQPGTCPPEEQASFTGLSLDLAIRRLRRRFEERNLITTPRRCPQNGQWTTGVDLFSAGGFDALARDPSPCGRKGRRRRRIRCQVVNTYIGAATTNTGQQLTQPSVHSSASCDQRLEGTRMIVVGKTIVSAEDGNGNPLPVTADGKTVVNTADVPKGQGGAVSVTTNPSLQRGDRVVHWFIGPGTEVKTEDVM